VSEISAADWQPFDESTQSRGRETPKFGADSAEEIRAETPGKQAPAAPSGTAIATASQTLDPTRLFLRLFCRALSTFDDGMTTTTGKWLKSLRLYYVS